MTDGTPAIAYATAPRLHYYTTLDGETLTAAVRPREHTWRHIAHRYLSKHTVVKRKEAGPYITFCEYEETGMHKQAARERVRVNGHDQTGSGIIQARRPILMAQRAKNNVAAITGLVFDFDDPQGPYGFTDYTALLDSLGCCYALYATFSYDPTVADKAKKFRVIVPLAHPVVPEIFKAALTGLAELLGLKPGQWDAASEKPSQPMYLPAAPANRLQQAKLKVRAHRPLLAPAESILLGMDALAGDAGTADRSVGPGGSEPRFVPGALEREFLAIKGLREVLEHWGYEVRDNRARRPGSDSPPAVQITEDDCCTSHSPNDPLRKVLPDGGLQKFNAYQAFITIATSRSEADPANPAEQEGDAITPEGAKAMAREFAGLNLVATVDDLVKRYRYDARKSRVYDTVMGEFIPKDSMSTVHADVFDDPNAWTLYKRAKTSADIFYDTTWQPAPYGCEPRTILTGPGGRNVLNRACAMLMEPVEGDVSPWLDLVNHIIPDMKEREVWLDWIAFTVLRPDIKILWHPHIWGGGRIGKDSIYKPAIRILNSALRRMAQELKERHITGNFQDTLDCKKLLIVPEVMQKNNLEFVESLKLWMAGGATETITINPKGFPEYEQPNLFSIATISNHSCAFPVRADSTRHFVIKAGLERPLDSKIYKNYHAWFDTGQGAGKVLAWMMRRDLSKFDYGCVPFKTDAFKAMVAESEERDWKIIIEQEILPTLLNQQYFTTQQVLLELQDRYPIRNLMPGLRTITEYLQRDPDLKRFNGSKKINGKKVVALTAFCTKKVWEEALSKKTQRGLFDLVTKQGGIR